ncbi:MAG: phosphomannomutase/phosphoglucomutase [Planctomycetes bacterium]|nr:phosphomannomutase/phosphoglucomutase [Planctomycetota bacterium]
MGPFKAYDIRGVYGPELNEDLARKIGFATATHLGAGPSTPPIVVGRDMRPSSPAMAKAAMEGITLAGANVIDIGLAPTPMAYFAIGSLGAAGGLQVTASHNPAKYTGFKVCREQAIPIGSDSGLAEIEQLATSGEMTPAATPGTVEEKNILDAYRDHVLRFADRDLRPIRIVIDAGNGMAGYTLPRLFEKLPGKLTPMFFELDGTFPNHEANPLKPENTAALRAKVVEMKADLGAAFDGDGDRVAFVDETGKIVPSDIMTALIARAVLKRQPTAIVYDLRSSLVVAEEIEKWGGRPIREKVGHAFIRATLRRENGFFGGELSGHYYFAENYFSDSAEIAFLLVWNLMSEEMLKLSALVRPLKRYVQSGELNFHVEDKDGKIEELRRTFPDARIDDLDGITVQYDDWWFNVRKSNTEPLLRLNLEADGRDRYNEVLPRVLALLGKPE